MAVEVDEDVSCEDAGGLGGAVGPDAAYDHASAVLKVQLQGHGGRDVGDAHAHPRPADAPVLQDGLHDGHDGEAADGEAHALRASHDGGVDADDLAVEVDKRAAAVALVDGGVGLDQVRQRLLLRRQRCSMRPAGTSPARPTAPFEILHAMMFRAEEWGLRERNTNPCLGIAKNPRNNVARFLDADELARLGRAQGRCVSVPAPRPRPGRMEPHDLLADGLRRCRARQVHLHDLRHTPASQAVMSGENLPLVGKLLGHRRHRTTASYAHLNDAHLVDAAERVANIIHRAMCNDGGHSSTTDP